METARLLRLLSLFAGMSVLQQVRSWSIAVPETVTAVEGSCVVVPCQTQPHSRVTWYQYHKIHYPVVYDGLHPHKVEHQFRGRTSVLGKAAEGNCTLVIRDVKTTDNNLQVYVWINPDSKTSQKFYDQTVTIFVVRKAPIISIQKQIVDGEMFQANCSVSYSCPFSPPPLHWNRSPFLKNVTLVTFNEKVEGKWMYTETLHGLATYEMHNGKMRCSAQFSSFTTESQQVILSVSYKPVTVTLILKKEPVMEGGSVIVECAAKCNPPPHTYSWFKRQMGQNTETNSTQRKMPFNNITRDTSLACIARNNIGAGQSDWVHLDVQYAPLILPESSCHLTGELLKCVCQAEASPNASMYWTIDGNNTLPSTFSLVSTNNKNVASEEISGPAQSQYNVSCTATNSWGSDTKQLTVDKTSMSKTSYLSTWLTASMLLGIALLLGFAVFIHRKYSRDRPAWGFMCNTTILLRPQNTSDNDEEEQRYNAPKRSQHEVVQYSPCRPESNPEEDRLSCVYDNDCVEEMRQTTARQHQREVQPLATGAHCNMEVYVNC